MAMATDELIRKATTTTTQLDKLIPDILAGRLESNLRKGAVLQQSLSVNTDLMVPNAGDTVYLPTLPDLGAADDLVEGTDMTAVALSTATSVALTPAEVGKTVEVTRKALDRISYDGIAEIIDRLGYSMTQKIEDTIASLHDQAVPGTSDVMVQVYPNGHTSSTVVSADVMDADTLLTAMQKVHENNLTPFDDGLFQLYINPSQFKALILDSDVRNDLRYGNPQAILRNEVGMLFGCRIVVTNWIKTATENSTTVAKALLVSPRWAFIAYKRKPQITIDPTVYDMGRKRRFGVTADYTIKLVHYDRAFVITTAA
jgi:N4-gp56 family major capsid protein